jgi:hypothetical protein
VFVWTVLASTVEEFPVELRHSIMSFDMSSFNENGTETPIVEVHLHFLTLKN